MLIERESPFGTAAFRLAVLSFSHIGAVDVTSNAFATQIS